MLREKEQFEVCSFSASVECEQIMIRSSSWSAHERHNSQLVQPVLSFTKPISCALSQLQQQQQQLASQLKLRAPKRSIGLDSVHSVCVCVAQPEAASAYSFVGLVCVERSLFRPRDDSSNTHTTHTHWTADIDVLQARASRAHSHKQTAADTHTTHWLSLSFSSSLALHASRQRNAGAKVGRR